MIRTVAELLEAFQLREIEILDNQNLKHAPTIGRMYEGLTQEILRQAIPSDINLRVVSGFIESYGGELSRQIDCMLVSGEGTPIPYTEELKYHIAQVIAVIEVKKNLYSNELDSAYRNLLSTKELSLKGLKDEGTSVRLFREAFYSLVGEDPFSYEDFDQMPFWKKHICLALNSESLIPIRMAIGYHGFASENSLREAFISYLNEKIDVDGYGPVSLPNLITSGDFSLIKLNCMPYGIRVNSRQAFYDLFGLFDIDPTNIPVSGENMWPLYASYPANPLLLLLELIWTRLGHSFQLNINDDDLGIEVIRPLVLAKAIERDGQVGWHYEFIPFSDEQLAKLPTLLNWRPMVLNKEQSLIVLHLIDNENSGEISEIDIHDPELVKLLNSNIDELDRVIKSISRMGILDIKDEKISLSTRHLKVAAMPNGEIVAGDDNEGMFTKWLLSQTFS
ncbi:MAG: hypothetical protein CL608_29350 [Anaerolineaceae bacterium]|nr:hypothetical protein [Anaerolineaceae bacterium]